MKCTGCGAEVSDEEQADKSDRPEMPLWLTQTSPGHCRLGQNEMVEI